MVPIQRSIIVMALVAGVAGIVIAGGGFSPPYLVGGLTFIAAFLVGHVAREGGWDDALSYQRALDASRQLARLDDADLRKLSTDEKSSLGRLATALDTYAELIRQLLRRLDYDSSSYSMGIAIRDSQRTDLEEVLARARDHVSAAADALRLAAPDTAPASEPG